MNRPFLRSEVYAGKMCLSEVAWLPQKADHSSPTLSEEFTLRMGEAERIEDVVSPDFDIDNGTSDGTVVQPQR